jgi:hypothetical protein
VIGWGRCVLWDTRPYRLDKGLIVYSLPVMCALWATVGVTIGWTIASHKDYRPDAGPAWIVIKPTEARSQLPVAAFSTHVVARAKVPVWNTVSVAAAAPFDGLGGSTIVRTRIRRHAQTGVDCYAPRTHEMLEYAA